MRGIGNARGHAAIRVAKQNDLRAKSSGGRDASDESIGSQHGTILADAIARAFINPDRAPPIRRVAQDNLRCLQFPWLFLFPTELRAERIILRERGVALFLLD